MLHTKLSLFVTIAYSKNKGEQMRNKKLKTLILGSTLAGVAAMSGCNAQPSGATCGSSKCGSKAKSEKSQASCGSKAEKKGQMQASCGSAGCGGSM